MSLHVDWYEIPAVAYGRRVLNDNRGSDSPTSGINGAFLGDVREGRWYFGTD